MKKETIAGFQMLTCAFLWSAAGILMKLIPWNCFAISSIRSMIAGITIIVFMFVNRIHFSVDKEILIGAFFAAATYTCFTAANKLTTAANAIVIQFTSPIFIVLYSVLIKKEKLIKVDGYVVLLTLIGIALFFLDQLKPGYLFGNIVALIAGISMAGMYIFLGDLSVDHRFSGVAIAQLMTFIFGIPAIIITKPCFDAVSTLSIFALGIFQLGLAYCLYAKAGEFCPALTCSLLGAFEPLLNPIWVMIFDGETPGIFAFFGGIIVIGSITIWSIIKGKNSNNQI